MLGRTLVDTDRLGYIDMLPSATQNDWYVSDGECEALERGGKCLVRHYLRACARSRDGHQEALYPPP